MMYEWVKTVHLISAVIFGGVVFTEVILLPAVRKRYGEERYREIEKTIITERGIKIVPIFVILLYLTGLYMFHHYIKGLDISTTFGKLLILKVTLALTVIPLVAVAIYLFLKGKSDSRFFDTAHKIIFVLVFSIIILAKLMFIL
ncbi:hypothetical protein GWK41_03010 [Persephonella atlantica]|uniref:Copper resistance protein D domain-containing protein n=1 Tax=Persephonella atlantica TaxID=2699429 RepID=A0ABS1GGM9_9AQUI|nr:hypothetical protein [Persephonella atlantica]MBK3332036.1 hypothetical protein [Persephonella atlantica]